MRQIRQVLRLKYEHGLPNRAIAKACSMGVATVADYLGRARGAALSWPLPEGLDDGALEARLFRAPEPPAAPRPLPSFAHVHQELKRPGVTLLLLWMEYLRDHPGGYRYSQFCERYGRFAKKLHPSMRQIHRAGEKVFVDFSGKKPHWVNPATGEVMEAELFVGALGASGYIYAEATPSQDLSCWIEAHLRMLETWEWCPAIFVPDNLKSGVTTPCRYEPVVNRTYEEMAGHYGAAVVPARVRRPKDKARAEASVLLAQRWILAVLRNRTFFSLAELNRAIQERVVELNARVMKKLGVSRRQLFEEIDRPAMKALPPNRYEIGHWKECGVSIDYHIELERNYYSVPYQLLHERVEARFTTSTVEIFFRSRRIASHRRLFGRGQASTSPQHMPASHRAYAEWTPSRLVQWAEKTGPATGRLVAKILQSRPHPEQGFRSCLGILRLAKTYGPERLDVACGRTESLGVANYRTVKNILSAGLDRLAPEEEPTPNNPTLPHENIRGASYYAEKESPC